MPDSTPRVPEAIEALKTVLEREKESGTKKLSLSTESLQQLHQLPGQLQAQAALSRQAQAKPEIPASTSIRVEEANPVQAAPATVHKAVGREDAAAAIASLAAEAEQDQDCRGLGTLRDVMVFSVGSPTADLMFVGEAPGFEEERQREPFVGPAGQKLTQIIKAMGLRRPEDVYISNIVKFRPLDGDARFQGQRNRKPSPVEMGASVKYVRAEIEIVKPKVIVALGATAAEGLLEISGSISRLRNQFHDLGGIPVMVTYHPSYVLRQESKSPDGGKADKRKVWEDMLKVMEQVGLPISEKQRGFFR